MYKYPYVDDPEPQKKPETGEDKIIRHEKRFLI